MKKYLLLLHRAITRFFFALACLSLATICVSISYEVVVRYFLNSPTSWANDLSGYLLCSTLFFGAPEVARTNGHIAITFVIDMLPEKIRHTSFRIISFLVSISCLLTAAIAFPIMVKQFDSGIKTIATVQIPKWILIAVIIYGFIGMSFSYFLISIRSSEEDS